MNSRLKICSILFALLFLAGCIAGRNFDFHQEDSIKLGQTTYEEIIERYGKPLAISQYRENKDIQQVAYGYSHSGKGVKCLAVGRTLRFFFDGDTLVGYDFYSCFEEDSTLIDWDKLDEIKEGETTRRQVIDILGDRFGEYKYPMIRDTESDAIFYRFEALTKLPPRPEFYIRNATIYFDKQGVVKDIETVFRGLD